MSAIPSTSAAFRTAAGLVICAWALALPAAARGDAARGDDALDLPRYAVWVEEGRLSVDLGPVPLAEVLEDIAAQAGIGLRIRGDPGEVLPQAFLEVPLEEGIRRLVGRLGLVMRYEAEAEGEAGRRVASILVHGRRGEAQAAVEPAPVPEAAPPPAWRSRSAASRPARVAAIRTMARNKTSADLLWLTTIARLERDAAMRRLAVIALGRAGGPRAAGTITRAMRDPDTEVRLSAIRALGRALGEVARPTLRRLAANAADPSGQKAASYALQELERRAAATKTGNG